MEKSEIVRYRQIYRGELFDSVIPFWLNHSLDREFGGLYNLPGSLWPGI